MVRRQLSIALLLLGLVSTGPAGAHPDATQDALHLLLERFASGLVNGDVERVAATLASDGRFLGLGRTEYLSAVASGGDTSNVVLDFATYEPIAGRAPSVRISPIVGAVDRGSFQFSWTATAAQRDGVWKLIALEPSERFPEQLVRKNLAELTQTTPVTISLVDGKTRAPLYARVSIEDSTGKYWPPRGHQKHIRVGWRQDVGGDVRIGDETYAYVSPTFVADLPPGEHTITAMKSMEYAPAKTTIKVTGEPSAHEVAMARTIDMNARGWYSGDTHVHFLDDHTALLEALAEDLNVVNVLATRWGELITNVEHVTGAPSRLSMPERIVYFNEETRHNWIGHAVLHRLKELVYPLSWGGPSEGVRGAFDYPAMAHQADKVHAQGGMVTWAHFPFPGGEVAVDVALDKVDSVDLFTWGDAFVDVPAPNGGTVPGAVSLWYQFLNTGFELPATAGTDKMLNVQVAGSVRTYAQVRGKFDYDRWCDAIRQGRTFVTTGPMISFTVDGKPIGATIALQKGGKVRVEAEVTAPFDRYPVDVLEIVAGGKVVAAAQNTSRGSALRLSHTLDVTSSTWIAARARGSTLLPYQVWALLGPAGRGVPPMAHTSPIYVSVAGAPIRSPEDASALEASVDRAIEWAKTTARYQREEERAEVVALYESAKRVYAAM